MACNSFLYVIYVLVKHFYRELFVQKLSGKQIFLEKVTGKNFTKDRSEYVWIRIENHRWYISEKLGRDIGLNVAAVDFIENIAAKESSFNYSDNRKIGKVIARDAVSTFV